MPTRKSVSPSLHTETARGRVDRLWTVEPGHVAGILHGDLPTKSNQRRLVMVGTKHNKRPLFIKSKDAIDFEDRFRVTVLGSQVEGIPLVGATNQADIKRGVPFLELSVQVYGASLQRDLDCELLPDVLQKFGVINNDRAIRHKNYFWRLTKDNPRVEFAVRILGSGCAVYQDFGEMGERQP